MSSRCEMESCPNWSGDGRVCPCALFDLDPPEPPRCELDYNPDGGNDGVCMARLDQYGNCTRKGGYHDDETGAWLPDDEPCGARFGHTGVCDMPKGHPPISETMGWLHSETLRGGQ